MARQAQQGGAQEEVGCVRLWCMWHRPHFCQILFQHVSVTCDTQFCHLPHSVAHRYREQGQAEKRNELSAGFGPTPLWRRPHFCHFAFQHISVTCDTHICHQPRFCCTQAPRAGPGGEAQRDPCEAWTCVALPPTTFLSHSIPAYFCHPAHRFLSPASFLSRTGTASRARRRSAKSWPPAASSPA